MKEFNLRNYPANKLLMIVVVITTLNVGGTWLYGEYFTHKAMTIWDEIKVIIGSNSVAGSVLLLVNSKLMWKPFLAYLDLCDVRGVYEGQLESSYFVDDDPAKPHVTKYCKLTIYQNINGILVRGEFKNSRDDDERSSTFMSEWCELKKDEDKFLLYYLYKNEVNDLHPDHMKYILNNHTGYASLQYDPATHALDGWYFNHERGSHGNLKLQKTGK